MKGVFGKDIDVEYRGLGKAFDELGSAWSNMFLPTIVFDKEKTKKHLVNARNELDKVV
jgi:hypothetical protein